MKKAEAITVPNSNSAEQNEPQPNPNNALEVTTMPINTMEDRGREEPRLNAYPQQEEPSPEPQRIVPDSVPTDPTTTTLHEEDNARTDTPTEQNNRAPTHIMPPPVNKDRPEPNVLDIMDDE